jgi:2-C-methyl-D-erythritol 4-phosphate cytidylyltransferase
MTGMPTPDVIAIIFAGGIGTRMKKAGLPKQFQPVDGKPVLAHTLEHFQQHSGVGAIYLVCVASHLEDAWSLVRTYGIDKVRTIVPGGATAQESIYNGLCSASADGVSDDALVLVHDGVRPLINQQLITRNIETARECGCAITAIPCFETVARSIDFASTIESVTRRDEMHILQAPQTLPLGLARQLNARAMADGLLGTFVDQAQLMNHYGEKLHLVAGFRGNVKITTHLDLLQFELLVTSGHLATVIGEG